MFKHTTFFLLVFLFLISSSRAQWITLPHAPLPVSGPPDFASIGFLDITAVGDGRLLYEVTVNDNHPGYYPSYGYKISYNDLRSGQDLIYTSPAFLNSFPPIKNMVYVNDSTFAMNQNIGQWDALAWTSNNFTTTTFPATPDMFNGHNLGVSPNSIFWISELISSQYDSMKTVVISRAGGAFQLYKTNLYKAFPNTVQFIDDSTGFLLAGPASYTPVNYLLKTSNGGQSWNPVFTSSNDSIMEFHALPSGTIYILQHSGTVSKGISWGSSWSTQTPVPSGSHNSIHFMTDSTGYAAGDLGRLYKTIDFANTWTMESDTTTCSINRIYTFGNVAYYVDARLNVYKNGPLVAGLNELKLQMPVKVYPNPASDEIIVNIPFNCCAKGVIQIYNATGMLVLTLPYTQNQTSVNLTDLPQGMYLVRVVDEKGIGSTQIIKR